MKKRLIPFLTLALLTLAGFAPPQQAGLALEQRVAQMFLVTLHGAQITEAGRDFLQRWQPGGVVLFTSNTGAPGAVAALTNAYQQAITAAGGPPLLIAIDQEGGIVQRLTDGFTAFPGPMIAAAAGPETARRYGYTLASELAAVGINMNLAPVADLETNLDNPIIRLRSFGSVPDVVGEAIAGTVQGIQDAGVLATLKHFPGHGDTSQDSHVILPALNHTRERLDAVELVPFRAGIEAGAAAVMVAHIWYPQIEPEPGLPASLSPAVITGLLRNDLGFDGLVLTDALDMDAIDTNFTYEDAAVRAVLAGADLISAGPGVGLPLAERMIQAVLDAVRAGTIAEARIDESVRRIFDAKRRFGLLDWQPVDASAAPARVGTPEHAAVLDELFRAGVTLAYDDNGLLPLRPDQRVAIAFLATRAQIYNECGLYRSDIRWVGIGDAPGDDEIGWAQDAARWADVMVVFTQNAISNPRQQALVRALPPEKTVVVAIFSPYDWRAFPDIAGYALTYSPARPAVPAACAALFGAIPFTGRLPVALEPALPQP